MDTNLLEFLFVGPLYSINKEIKALRRQIVGLREDLEAYAGRIDQAAANIRADFAALDEKIANAEVPEDVSEALAKLGESVGSIEGLDRPDLPPVSPGEPPLEEQLPAEPSGPTEAPEGEQPQVNPL